MIFNRNVSLVVAVPMIIGTFAVVTAARWPGPITACQTAAAWVVDHRSELPSTLDGIRRYSKTYQIAILSATPLEARKQMWKEQIESFVSPVDSLTPLQRAIRTAVRGADLTDHQRALLRREVSRLNIYFDPSRTVEERQDAIEESAPQLNGAFQPALLAAIFKTLGPASLPRGAAVAEQAGAPTDAAPVAATGGVTASTVRLSKGCNCYTLGDPCCGPDSCGGGLGNQTCGFYGDQPCDGTTYQCRPAKKTVTAKSLR